jgi:transcription antitermination factor NusG
MVGDKFPWFALRVRANFEQLVAVALRHKGYEHFLPLYSTRRQWSDRIKDLKRPLFPGYLFCRFDPAERLPILKTPSVIGIVGIGKMPIPVEPKELAAVQKIVQSGLASLPWPFPKVGHLVSLEHGPLAGIDGTVLSIKNGYKLVVSITLLQRSVAVEIDSAWITPRLTPVHGHTVAPGYSLTS